MCRAQAGADLGGGVAVTTGRELLPAHVVPKHYDLTLEPDFKDLTFKGHVIIDLDCVEETKSVSLHTRELEVHNVKVGANGATIR